MIHCCVFAFFLIYLTFETSKTCTTSKAEGRRAHIQTYFVSICSYEQTSNESSSETPEQIFLSIHTPYCDYSTPTKVLTYLASPHPVSGLHMWPSPINPRARCASGARSPLAPTVPCSGTQDKQDAMRGNKIEANFSTVGSQK